MKRFKTVDEFMKSETLWRKELASLRKILNKTELVETVKWGIPAYTIGGKNVIGIGSFKSYFGIWFFQGAFLKDRSKKLINAQEGRTKGMRQWRMTSIKEIDEPLILEYVEEAIRNQKEGKEVKPEKKPLIVPDELKQVFKKDPLIKKAFANFGLGDQRDFAEHISEAKREETRQKRLEKIIPMILGNVGLNDKYKK